MISIRIPVEKISKLHAWAKIIPLERYIAILAIIFAVISTAISFHYGWIVNYGDAESHLNIAKRVVHSITPSFAQLGGIWLPLPHLMLLPFVYSDFLWRTGLAGSIVSGLSFVVTTIYLYKLTFVLTKSRGASFLSSLLVLLNPNMLYFQTTPMTELPLIMFFTLSSYYFMLYLLDQKIYGYVVAAGFFGFCATVTRYDGWFLVGIEAAILGLLHFPWRQLKEYVRTPWVLLKSQDVQSAIGKLALFCTLAFFGIGLWLMWDQLILGDAFYFTNSEFSAKSQQNIFLQGNMLPGYHHLGVAILYYFVTSLSNVGVIIFITSLVGFGYFLLKAPSITKLLIGVLLGIIFVFNVFTMFVGQSVIFIPSLSPRSFGANLFNVRYGLLMVPFAAVFFAYLFSQSKIASKLLLLSFIPLQLSLYAVGYSKVITYEDGVVGVSSAERPEAERWMKVHYDGGLVLLDDYARTISIVRSGIPMQNMIYIGNKPYWEESLREPDKYVTWIAMRDHDAVAKKIYDDPAVRARLLQHFDLVYTEKEIKIYKKKSI